MESQRLKLMEVIQKEVFITKDKERIAHPNGIESNWLFDFRRVLLQAKTLGLISELFWEKFEKEPSFQIGGIEVAAIPLITGLVVNLSEPGREINGFFIRKSRKKDGLLRMIEGKIGEEKIILVDDIINTGKSFIRQVEVIESFGKKIDIVFAILRFRDMEYYKYFHDKGIKIISLFTLDDFLESLDVKNTVDKTEEPVPMPFKVEWYWKAEKPDHYKVMSKSAPIVDESRVYLGTDNGSFWALNQSDGRVAWGYKILFDSKRRKAFSSPVLGRNTVYFGAHDGNFYALDKNTGKRKWVFMEADWIGSSPAIAQDLGLIFINLEFGLWKKHASLVALETETGEKKWEHKLEEYSHSSPAYAAKYGIVVGGGDKSVFGLSANSGKLLWHFPIEEVRGSFAFDDTRGFVCFGASDGNIYILNTKNGDLTHKIAAGEAIYSTPFIYSNIAYVSSLDKNLYAINLDTGNIDWKFATNGRIFASPEIIGGKIYIGSNDGRLYELDALTGKNTAFFQAVERITDKIAYNPETKMFFLPTFANELYCLKNHEV